MPNSIHPIAEFGELPDSPRGAGRSRAWQDVADKLKASPGSWACVLRAPDGKPRTNYGYLIKRGKLSAFKPAGSYDGVIRGAEVWARYVGDDTA